MMTVEGLKKNSRYYYIIYNIYNNITIYTIIKTLKTVSCYLLRAQCDICKLQMPWALGRGPIISQRLKKKK